MYLLWRRNGLAHIKGLSQLYLWAKGPQKGYTDCKSARSVNARKADRVILDAVLNQIPSPSFIESLLDEIQGQTVDAEKMNREIGDTNNLIILTERSVTRLLKLAEGAGIIEELTARMKELKQEKDELTAKIKQLKAERELEIPTITPEALTLVFSTWYAQIEKAVKNNEILTAKKLLAQFVSKIEIGHDTTIIHYCYPVAIPSDDIGIVSPQKPRAKGRPRSHSNNW